MNELKIFEKSDFGQIRVNQNEYGEPLFCLADVCKALKLQVQATKSRLSEKGVSSINTLTNGGVQSLIFINEQNLYKAIFQSRKKEAEKFTDWVTGEVLPTIRKNGKFKSLTSDGLEFGENMVSPENPRETQIMLYEDKFSDLFEMYLDHIKF